MQIVPWILAAFFAALALYFALRPGAHPYAEAVKRISDEAEGGRDLGEAPAGDPPEVAQLRLVLSGGWRPIRNGEDPGDLALLGLFRYLEGAALTPIEEALRSGELLGGAEDTANALRDLAFYAKGTRVEEATTENLSAIVQGVTREYTRDTGIAIRFDGPSTPVPVRIAPESFKDALYLLLANADRFGDGKSIDIAVELEGDRVRLKVMDRGAGFTQESLARAFDPFWTSEKDALGLGLPHARRLLGAQGALLAIANRTGGGGEATITLSKAR
jgi:signal transduction histidine kinase